MLTSQCDPHANLSRCHRCEEYGHVGRRRLVELHQVWQRGVERPIAAALRIILLIV